MRTTPVHPSAERLGTTETTRTALPQRAHPRAPLAGRGPSDMLCASGGTCDGVTPRRVEARVDPNGGATTPNGEPGIRADLALLGHAELQRHPARKEPLDAS